MHQKQREIIPLLLGEQLHLDECTHHLKINKTINYINIYDLQWNFPSVRLIKGVCLIEVVKIVQCLLTINIQWLLCTVIKLHVVKEAIESSSSLPFITNLNLFVHAKTLTDFSTYFKDVIQYHCIVNSVRLIEVFNNRN